MGTQAIKGRVSSCSELVMNKFQGACTAPPTLKARASTSHKCDRGASNRSRGGIVGHRTGVHCFIQGFIYINKLLKLKTW